MSAHHRPPHLAVVRDLLRETLAVARENVDDYGYGLAIFPRPGRFGDQQFGVMTSGGESTTLTYRLLRELHDTPLYVSGRVLAEIGEGLPGSPRREIPPVLLDQPVLRLNLRCWIGITRDDRDRVMPLDSTFLASELLAPIVLLLDERPAGWPA
ncbi:MAG TPA: hypothetical protein VNK43_08340 [Gemmatimonadales bacterium]|nr:hypothetical protein [Gemmatimonadales bacterium]